MNGQPITWDGPGEAMMGATIQDNNVVLYLCNDEDEYSIQEIPIEEFQIWASTVLAEIALTITQ